MKIALLCVAQRAQHAAPLLPLLLLLLAACAPGQPPPNLNATPGAAVVVTRDHYRNDLFSVEYPSGWRVITSQAGAPPSVTLVAPGDCALIMVSPTPVEAPVSAACDVLARQPDIQTVAQTVTLGSLEIVLAGSAPAAEWDAFSAAFDRVAGSLQASGD